MGILDAFSYSERKREEGRENTDMFVLKYLLLCALMVGTVHACTLKNHTFWIESQGCGQCVAINTTICSGYCYTQDTNLRGRFGRSFMIQRSCVPLSLVYRAVHIPGCPQDVVSQMYYPVAQCCSCRRCDTRTHHCVQPGRISYNHCDPVTHGSVKNRPAFET